MQTQSEFGCDAVITISQLSILPLDTIKIEEGNDVRIESAEARRRSVVKKYVRKGAVLE